MEKLKPGRKPLPEDQKKVLVSAYLTKKQKELIIKHFGNLSLAVMNEILPKLEAIQYQEKQEEIFLTHQ
jgi:hypothetical protein